MKQTFAIMEENSCGENLSNFGQGSPMKPQPAFGNLISNFSTTLKSMTPMPKLAQTFSQPSTNNSDKLLNFDLQPVNQKQA